MICFVLLDRTLTAEYSINAPNTNMRHATIQASKALMYDTYGEIDTQFNSTDLYIAVSR